MRVLVVLTQPPLAEGSAPGKTALGLLRGLAEHGVDVRAVAARREFAVTGEPAAGLDVELVDVPALPAWRARVGALRHPRGELGGRFADRVATLAREADVVHLEETESAGAARGISIPTVLHVHYLVRHDRAFGLPWQRQFREVLEYRRAERSALRRHRQLVASSPLIAEALRREAPAAAAEVTLAPLSLDGSLYTPAPLDGPPTAGIIGTAAWPPTASAIRLLLEQVWPLVRRRVPDARLLIAGRGTEELEISAGTGVEVLGAVDSARAFMRGLSVLLYPLDRGSGMKVKTLEALASGVPVVTSPAGAEGAEVEGVVVCRAAEELAAAAAEVLADAALRQRLGAAARREFDVRYAPLPATAPLVELYERLVSRRAGA